MLIDGLQEHDQLVEEPAQSGQPSSQGPSSGPAAYSIDVASLSKGQSQATAPVGQQAAGTCHAATEGLPRPASSCQPGPAGLLTDSAAGPSAQPDIAGGGHASHTVAISSEGTAIAGDQAGSVAQQAVPAATAPKVVTVPAASKLESLQAAAASLDATNVADLAALVRDLCSALDNQTTAQVCLLLLKDDEPIVSMLHCVVSKRLPSTQGAASTTGVSQSTIQGTSSGFTPSQRLAQAWEACLKCGVYCLAKIDMAANKVQHMHVQSAEDTSSWIT